MAGALSDFPHFAAQCTDQKGPGKRQNSSQLPGVVTSFPLRFYRNYQWGQGRLGNYANILLFLFTGVRRVSRARQQRSTLTRPCGGACGVLPPSKIYFRLTTRCAGMSSLHRRGALPAKKSGEAAVVGFLLDVAFSLLPPQNSGPVPHVCVKFISVPSLFISFFLLIYSN